MSRRYPDIQYDYQDKFTTNQTLFLLFVAIVTFLFGSYFGARTAMLTGRVPDNQYTSMERECLEAAGTELSFLANNALDGYTILIKDRQVEIRSSSKQRGVLLVTGPFLEGAENCRNLLGEWLTNENSIANK